MTLGETLTAVWQQALADEKPFVELEGKRCRVEKTSGKRLRTVSFDYGAHRMIGIEQNPRTASRWAEMARQGQRIMQVQLPGTVRRQRQRGQAGTLSRVVRAGTARVRTINDE